MESTKPALTKPTFIKMDALQPGTRVNMHLRVHSVKITKKQQNWEDELVCIGEAIVGDEFGCAKLKATDN